MNEPFTEGVLEGIKGWAKRERAHNPSFSLVVGRKSFTIDQIVEHVEKRTPEGRELLGMIGKAAADLFLSG